MTGDVIAIAIAVVVCVAGLTAWVVIPERLDRRKDGHHDPYVAGLRDDSHETDDPHEVPWWEQHGPGRLDMLPPDPPPDPTLVQAVEVQYLGKTSDELVAELFESARQEAIAADWHERQAEGRSDLEAKVIP